MTQTIYIMIRLSCVQALHSPFSFSFSPLPIIYSCFPLPFPYPIVLQIHYYFFRFFFLSFLLSLIACGITHYFL